MTHRMLTDQDLEGRKEDDEAEEQDLLLLQEVEEVAEAQAILAILSATGRGRTELTPWLLKAWQQVIRSQWTRTSTPAPSKSSHLQLHRKGHARTTGMLTSPRRRRYQESVVE